MESPPPTALPGEALVRPTRVAITQTELSVTMGATSFQGVLGRLFIGVVEHVNTERPDQLRWVGKRVAVNPEIPCGACERCRKGLAIHCASRAILGVTRRDGGLTDLASVPVGNLADIPKNLHDDAAIFALHAGEALHLARVTRIEGKPYVTVIGDSAEALVTAQVLSRMNASVRVLGSMAPRYQLCERWGVKHRHFAEVGKREDQDVVVEMTGEPAGLALAIQLARPRGTILLASTHVGVLAHTTHQPHVFPDLAHATRSELTLIGVRGGILSEGLDRLARGEIDVTALVQHRLRLPQWNEALMAARRPDLLRVLIEP